MILSLNECADITVHARSVLLHAGGRVTATSISPSAIKANDVFVLRFESGGRRTADEPLAVGFAAWGNGTSVGGEILYTTTDITFSVAPAKAHDCWSVTDMFGAALSAAARVCATSGASVSISLPANGSATGPVYLLPVDTEAVDGAINSRL